MMTRRELLLASSGIMAVGSLLGCQHHDAEVSHSPQPISAGDECHLCGMLIQQFPGPKGQLFLRGRSVQLLKFCSTRDLLAYLTQPESQAAVAAAFVHDMAGVDWHSPSGADYTLATAAVYVINHGLPGAMGPTFASFRRRPDAERFIAEHGGIAIGYQEISPQLVGTLGTPWCVYPPS